MASVVVHEGLTTIRLELFLDASEQYAAVIPTRQATSERTRFANLSGVSASRGSRWVGPLSIVQSAYNAIKHQWDLGDGQELFPATPTESQEVQRALLSRSSIFR